MHLSDVALIFASAFSVMLGSLTGVVFTFEVFGGFMRRHLTYLATFSAGVLTILAYHLIEEALREGGSLALVAGSIIGGAVALEFLHRLLPGSEHHHHGPASHGHSALDGRRVLFSDAVHNITDGFILVPAFLLDWTVGIAATAGVLLHELVQEVSEFFVLKEAGYSTRRALLLNFLVSSTILVGVVLALTLAAFEGVLAVLAGLAAGGFLAVVLRDLLPHAFHSVKAGGRGAVHAAAALCGVAVMFGVITLVPHAHAEAGQHDHEHEELVEHHGEGEAR